MVPRVAIGIDDFRVLRERGLEYVDKSDLIRELLDRAGVQAALFPRPRRFGKTLNLSMLRCWFEKRSEDFSHLFEGLSIWQAGPSYRAHFQRYPVIHMTFKGIKAASWDLAWAEIRQRITALFDEHRHVLDDARVSEREAREYRAILDGSAGAVTYELALLELSRLLERRHDTPVVILIDEYDEPIHAAYLHGYAQQAMIFYRTFLGEGLKGNPHLFRAVMTGILRVAKENLFSGLNHLGVYSLLRPDFHSYFGFTEPEVSALLERCGRASSMGDVRAWYNGYLFGGQVMYNPWSVLCFLDSSDARPRPYWLSTSSNDLVKELLERYALTLQSVFEALLEGGNVERRLNENVVLSELSRNEDALWSLLVFAGYLKAAEAPDDALGRIVHRLSIPNKEVREVYSSTFFSWMRERVEGHGGRLDDLTTALLGGDAQVFEEQLQAFVIDVLSYHDPGKLHAERVYQGFVVGLLAVLEPGHQVRSNRESGKGRPDVMIRPLVSGQPGVVLELKVARPGKKTLAQALAEGTKQLRAMDYEAELRACGAAPVHAFAVAFDGKTVLVRAVKPRKAATTKRPSTARKVAPRAKRAPTAKKAAPRAKARARSRAPRTR